MHVICPFCRKHLETPEVSRKEGICPECDNVFDLKTAAAVAGSTTNQQKLTRPVVVMGVVLAVVLLALAAAPTRAWADMGAVAGAYLAGQAATIMTCSVICALAIIFSLASSRNPAPAVLATMGWCLCAGVWLVGTLVLLRGVEPAPGAEGGVSPVFYGAIVVCFAAVGLGLVLLTRLRGPLAYRRAPVMVIATLTVGLTAGICAIVLHARPLLAGPELAPQDEAPRAAAPVRAPRRPTQPALSPGLRYKYYHSAGGKVPDFKDMEPVNQGIVESFTLEPAERDDNFAMIFEGMLKVPAEGKYRFHLGSDDGSHLYLDDSHVIDNDGAHGLVFKTATETLEDKPVAIKVTYAQGGGGARLSVRWEGPELNRQSIAGKYLAHTN